MAGILKCIVHVDSYSQHQELQNVKLIIKNIQNCRLFQIETNMNKFKYHSASN